VFDLRVDQAKGLFFDSKRVEGSVDVAERKVLSRIGAFVRRTARSSIRKRKRVSAPGQPPSSHTGLLKRFIFFAYEPTHHSVVIGPARLSQKVGDAPSALEHGGRSRVVVSRGKRQKRTVTIRPRPFMGPALERNLDEFADEWADSIRAG
jgi:hypothetical protein